MGRLVGRMRKLLRAQARRAVAARPRPARPSRAADGSIGPCRAARRAGRDADFLDRSPPGVGRARGRAGRRGRGGAAASPVPGRGRERGGDRSSTPPFVRIGGAVCLHVFWTSVNRSFSLSLLRLSWVILLAVTLGRRSQDPTQATSYSPDGRWWWDGRL